ncbi:MAG: hypothetical protein R3E97_21575, partial [Candidatus Eisenbacteria bacterium]
MRTNRTLSLVSGASRALAALLAAAASLALTAPYATSAELPLTAGGGDRLTDDLLTRLGASASDEFVPVIVTLSTRLDFQSLEDELDSRGIDSRWKRHRFVIDRAQAVAADSQAPLLAYLDTEELRGEVRDVHSYWVTNAVSFAARPAFLARMADLAESGTAVGGESAAASEGETTAEERNALASVSRIHLDVPVFLKQGTREEGRGEGEGDAGARDS